jgi:hypothetical protein
MRRMGPARGAQSKLLEDLPLDYWGIIRVLNCCLARTKECRAKSLE